MAEKSKKGKKRWIKIVGPGEFKNIVLGESYVIDPNILLGKKLKLSLGSLTGALKRQYALIGFKVKEIKGAEAHAEVVSYEMVLAHTKRLVRAGRDKIDDSFVVESKDKVKARIKPIGLTKNKAKNSILTRIRNLGREKIKEMFLKEDFNKALDEIISGRLQRSLKQELGKTYPLGVYDIRKLEVLNR